MRNYFTSGLILIATLCSTHAHNGIPKSTSTSTQIQYLSGTGSDHTVDWEFFCTGGRNSGMWTTIPVPSCWEQEGFGTYNYGRDKNKADEQGRYRHTFTVPDAWSDKHIQLVFEGSMTDTQVKINGEPAGEIHQGGFYRFMYDITRHLNFGEENLLEVTVSKMSSNPAVNNAERRADYWVFGGIFRPVYLRALPDEFIERTAIEAKADGTFRINAHLENIREADNLVVQIETSDGTPVGNDFSQPVYPQISQVTLETHAEGVRTWSAETPHLYHVVLELKKDGEVIHRVKEHFGFRTVEVRSGDGIYVNGRKIVLKGTNRHSFHPESGRTLNAALSLRDVLLMKDMNMNAVRMSHYPPDPHFLDMCDEKGLYVLDEIAGWQDAYDTGSGEKIVKATVTRDVNHPSVIFWCNGNEGGWNEELDDDFAHWDIQKRNVLHPWAVHSNIDTDHYERYQSTKRKLEGPHLFLPTEFLHGLYDGGHGAGLNDYWKLMMNSPLGAGGFTWSFVDEGVLRTDTAFIDVYGNNAPDGILGPYREKEASFFTIREIWSPVYIEMDDLTDNFTGSIPVENRYSFISLDQCTFKWKLVNFTLPSLDPVGYQDLQQGSQAGPGIGPGERGTVDLDLPGNWKESDAIILTAMDHNDREICSWTWHLKDPGTYKQRIVELDKKRVKATEDSSFITVNTKEHEFLFDKSTGNLNSIIHNGERFSFAGGPVIVSGDQKLKTLSVRKVGNDQVVEAAYDGNLKLARWKIDGSGWVQLHYEYEQTGAHEILGVSFSYPETAVKKARWLGKGPYRVYKNRMKGVNHNVWEKRYNNTITGQSGWEYPEFKGYHADVHWLVLETEEGAMTVVSEEDDLFVHLFTPEEPDNSRNAFTAFPPGDISFLDGIPAIGTKFMNTEKMGPESQLNVATGTYSRTLNFYFDTDK